MITPKISVVMPVRDGARWLSEALKSIQNQTLPDFELIVVDDGSADNSLHVIEAHSRNDSRFVVIRQERLGLVPALNRGLTESRAPLIARLDADDIAKPQRLERQSEYLKNHPEIGLVGTWADKIDEQGLVTGRTHAADATERAFGITDPDKSIFALLDNAAENRLTNGRFLSRSLRRR